MEILALRHENFPNFLILSWIRSQLIWKSRIIILHLPRRNFQYCKHGFSICALRVFAAVVSSIFRLREYFNQKFDVRKSWKSDTH